MHYLQSNARCSAEWQLQKCESQLLIQKARRKGIEIPRTAGWWEDDGQQLLQDGMPVAQVNELMAVWLSEIGILGAKRFFREERRKTFEWWYTKVIIPTLQAATPIIALFLIYFSRK